MVKEGVKELAMLNEEIVMKRLKGRKCSEWTLQMKKAVKIIISPIICICYSITHSFYSLTNPITSATTFYPSLTPSSQPHLIIYSHTPPPITHPFFVSLVQCVGMDCEYGRERGQVTPCCSQVEGGTALVVSVKQGTLPQEQLHNTGVTWGRRVCGGERGGGTECVYLHGMKGREGWSE